MDRDSAKFPSNTPLIAEILPNEQLNDITPFLTLNASCTTASKFKSLRRHIRAQPCHPHQTKIPRRIQRTRSPTTSKESFKRRRRPYPHLARSALLVDEARIRLYLSLTYSFPVANHIASSSTHAKKQHSVAINVYFETTATSPCAATISSTWCAFALVLLYEELLEGDEVDQDSSQQQGKLTEDRAYKDCKAAWVSPRCA